MISYMICCCPRQLPVQLQILSRQLGLPVMGADVPAPDEDAMRLTALQAPTGIDWLLDQLKAPGEVVVAAFVVLSLCCFVAQAIGLEAALGAFAAGLILSSSKHTHAIQDTVKPLVALFATIFFVLIGTGMVTVTVLAMGVVIVMLCSSML